MRLEELGKGLIVDLETRHRTLELKDCGADRYFAEGAEIMLVGWYDLETGRHGVWRPLLDEAPPWPYLALAKAKTWPTERKFISFGDFDFIGWSRLICPIPVENFVDIQVLAHAAGLPADLETVAEALGCTYKKDNEGHRLMLKMCKPNKKTGEFPFSPEMYDRLAAYCQADVLAEAEVLAKLPGFTVASEWDVHRAHTRMNLRGIRVDMPFVKAAAKLVDDFSQKKSRKIMDKYHISLTSRDDVMRFATEAGYELAGYAKDDVAAALEDDFLPPCLREILNARQLTAYAAVKKYQAFLDRTPYDAILRHQYKMNGAFRTGRWSGTGVQPQNFARGRKDLITIRDQLIAAILAEDIPTLERLSKGDIMAAAAACLRGAIKARDGHVFVALDYRAIEARLVLWEAGCKSLQVFADSDAGIGPEPYKYYASMIFGIPVEQVEKWQRAIGKETVLGCGYGLGPAKFMERLATYGVECDEALAEKCVKHTYRRLNPELCNFEWGMWPKLENAAKNAVSNPGVIVHVGAAQPMAFLNDGTALWFKLPSGRKLRYHRPRIEVQGKYGDEIRYWSSGMEEGKSMGWHETSTFSGKLAGNCTQALSADLTRDAMVKIDKVYPVVMVTHDEIMCEVPEAEAEKCKAFMTETIEHAPAWANGLPVSVEGWIDYRFCKT